MRIILIICYCFNRFLEVLVSNSDCLPQKNIDTLYKDHQGYLFAWLRKKLGCSESAADIAQDTFVRILQHRHKTGELPEFREPRASLTTVAGRLMHDLFRKQALEKAYLEALAQIPESIAPSAEEEHQIYALLYELDTILESLKPIVRQVFLLSQLQGLTYNEIAHKLAISERSVKRYMAMAFEECLILMM